jgi:hypothetical protein
MLLTATGNYSGPELSYVNRYIQFTTTGMTADVTHAAYCPLENNKWYQIVFTRRGNTWSSYVDGELISSTTSSKTINLTSSHIMKIGNYYVPGYAFKGSMTNVSIWTVALEQNFIANTLPNELNGDETGLMLYYNMNETGAGAGITVRNKAVTGNVLDGITGGTASTPYFTLITATDTPLNSSHIVYPNPSGDVLHLSNVFLPLRVRIYLPDGKLIKSYIGSHNYLNISDLKSGIYFVKIKTEKGDFVQKFVKK